VNTKPTLHCLALACTGLTLTAITGCSHWIELRGQSTDTGDPPAQMMAQDEQVPLILDRMRTTRNGSPQNSSADTEQRILNSLGDIGLFSHLASATTSAPTFAEKTVRARLLFDEAIDSHAGSAALKGIVLGASMYILTPFLPFEYEYAAHLSLELERWDGQIKHYESRSAGTARYHLFGATPIMIDELKGHVTETCLVDLARQIAQDMAFYAASSAPFSDSGIRTVSVKSRPSQTPASTPAAVPVSSPAPSEP
jgi:hypothetical protein